MNQLPAGLVDSNIEFFKHDETPWMISDGQAIAFSDFNEQLLEDIEIQLKAQPRKCQGLDLLGIFDKVGRIKQHLLCNYCLLDHHPDMIGRVLQATEYVPCSKRGICKAEGILCDHIQTETGEYLSKREVDVLKLVATGDLDKIIATKLNIKLSTVTTHTGNIRRKTRLFRKADLTRFAFQKNLI